MPDGKLIQQPSTHLMGQKFSKVFNATFKNENGKEEYLWTTAYGPAISRILVSVISIHGDDKGLILPYCISPIKAVIVPIYNINNKSKIINYCKEINNELEDLGIKAKLDDREEYSPGWKFNQWELRGVPFRIEVGERELKKKSLTLFTRDTGKKEILKVKALSKIKKYAEAFDERLRKKADKWMSDKITNCKTKEEIMKALSLGKIARVNFCSVEKEGEKCAEHVEKFIGAEVRGTLANKNEKPISNAKCAMCNKTAGEIVYIGRSY